LLFRREIADLKARAARRALSIVFVASIDLGQGRDIEVE